MSLLKEARNGFGLISTILVSLGIVTVGLCGWAVYRNLQNNDSSLSSKKENTISGYKPFIPTDWVGISSLGKDVRRDFVDYSIPSSWSIPRGGYFDIEVEIRPVFMGIKVGVGEPLLMRYIPSEDVFKELKINEKTGSYNDIGEVDNNNFLKSSVKAEDKYPTFIFTPVFEGVNKGIVVVRDDNMWIFTIDNYYQDGPESGYYCLSSTKPNDFSLGVYCDTEKLSESEWSKIIPDFIKTIKFY